MSLIIFMDFCLLKAWSVGIGTSSLTQQEVLEKESGTLLLYSVTSQFQFC